MKSARCLAVAATSLAVTALLAACNTYNPRKDDPVMRTWEENRFHQLYKLIDADGNGEVTPEEFQQHYATVTWLYFDKNGDGFITAAEWAIDGNSYERNQWFKSLDADGDGILTREEFNQSMSPEGTARYFELMDKDGSGVITVKDLERS